MISLILGTMGSGKTEHLIRRVNYYKMLSYYVEVYGNKEVVESRNGKSLSSVDYHGNNQFDGGIVFIDECQFLTDKQINYIIHDKEREYHIYGLVNDCNGNMFNSTKKLIQHANNITTLSKVCDVCGKNLATHHLLLTDKETLDKDKYESVCYECWKHLYNGVKHNELLEGE